MKLETWSRPLMRSGSTAVALLADAKSVELVLKAIAKAHKKAKYPVWGEGVVSKAPLGSQWLRAHNELSYPDKDALQNSVDAFFTIFNRREQEAAELAKRLRNEPDEDGFVTVTRGGRNAPARREDAEEAKGRLLEKEERKKNGAEQLLPLPDARAEEGRASQAHQEVRGRQDEGLGHEGKARQIPPSILTTPAAGPLVMLWSIPSRHLSITTELSFIRGPPATFRPSRHSHDGGQKTATGPIWAGAESRSVLAFPGVEFDRPLWGWHQRSVRHCFPEVLPSFPDERAGPFEHLSFCLGIARQ